MAISLSHIWTAGLLQGKGIHLARAVRMKHVGGTWSGRTWTKTWFWSPELLRNPRAESNGGNVCNGPNGPCAGVRVQFLNWRVLHSENPCETFSGFLLLVFCEFCFFFNILAWLLFSIGFQPLHCRFGWVFSSLPSAGGSWNAVIFCFPLTLTTQSRRGRRTTHSFFSCVFFFLLFFFFPSLQQKSFFQI